MKSKSFLSIVIGAVVGGTLGIIPMLFWYLNSGEYMGVMAGSGLSFLIIVPLASFALGGVPGVIMGGVIGGMLGILGKR